MKKVLIISYISKEIEGRVMRHYEILSKRNDLEICLVQACRKETEYSKELNVVNIDISSSNRGLVQYIEFTRNVIRILKKNKYDYCLLLNYYSAIFYRHCKASTVIYDAFELYYPGCRDNLSLRDRLFLVQERKAINHANTVIATNKARALIMIGLYRLNTIPIVVSNNPINRVGKVSYSEKNDAIVYAGYFGKERELEKLVESLIRYNANEKKAIELHFYGGGELEGYIKEKADTVRCIKYFGKYKNEDLNKILVKYKYGFIAYDNKEMNTRFCSPNKLFDYIFNDIVIICNDNTSLSEFVEKYKIGSAGPDFVKSIARVVNQYQVFYENTKNYRQSYKPSEEYKAFDELFV